MGHFWVIRVQESDLGSSDFHQFMVNMMFYGIMVVGTVRFEKENQERTCPAI